jgi:hypothetical protein
MAGNLWEFLRNLNEAPAERELYPDLVFRTVELLHNFSGKYLCGEHAWILGPRVSCHPEHPGLVNSSRAKLLEEGAAFLCAGDSGKPAARIFEDLRRERLPQY